MPNINYVTKSLAVKIVYYGPGLSGKTTNLRYIFSHLTEDSRGEFLCLETPSERTLFFDLLPVKAGMIQEFTTHFHLMTVPGQVFYEASRKSVLKGVDGIVFVADSQVPLLDANLENFNGLKKNLLQQNIDPNLIPLVFQYNKRDLDDLVPVEAFNNLFNTMEAPFVESSALNGQGVFETLGEISKLVIPRVKEQIFWEKIQTDTQDTMKRKLAVTPDQVILRPEKSGPKASAEGEFRMKKIRFQSQKDVDEEIDKLQDEFLN